MNDYYTLDNLESRHRVLKTIIYPKVSDSHYQLILCIRLWLRMVYNGSWETNWPELDLNYIKSLLFQDIYLESFFKRFARKLGRKIIVFYGRKGKITEYGDSGNGFDLALHCTEGWKWGLYGRPEWIENNPY